MSGEIGMGGLGIVPNIVNSNETKRPENNKAGLVYFPMFYTLFLFSGF